MPELPEVETLRRQLARKIKGKTIRSLVVADARLGSLPSLEGRRIADVRRTGKFLEIAFDDRSVLRIHLRMTGRLLWTSAGREETAPGGARFRLIVDGGEVSCIDPRRFATLDLAGPSSGAALREDPLRKPDPETIRRAARSRRLAVKAFLLDQKIFPGMGNIYACEVLHAAGIHPARAALSLTEREWKKVSRQIRAVLALAVRCRGTSISDWRDLRGIPGTYQDHLQVYGRQGESCPRCGGTIRRMALGGRGTWFCPGCQS